MRTSAGKQNATAKRLSSGRGQRLVLTFILSVALAGQTAPISGQMLAVNTLPPGRALKTQRADTTLEIVVMVYNYAHAPGRTVSSAEKKAAWILLKAGVEVRWLDCPASPEHAPVNLGELQRRCAQPPGGATVDLRILTSRASRALGLGQDVFGYALPSADTASAFYDRAVMASDEFGGDEDTGLILGDIIDHELGHLLLGPGHSPIGIMYGAWNRRFLEGALMREHHFTRDEAARLRAAVRERMSQPPVLQARAMKP